MSTLRRNLTRCTTLMHDLLDRFYPTRTITVTSADPHFVTPAVKAMLRRKNRLMRAGRKEEANALAARVRTVIARKSSEWLRNIDTRKCAKDTWSKVREVLKGRRRDNELHVEGSLLSRLMIITPTRHQTNTTSQPNAN